MWGWSRCCQMRVPGWRQVTSVSLLPTSWVRSEAIRAILDRRPAILGIWKYAVISEHLEHQQFGFHFQRHESDFLCSVHRPLNGLWRPFSLPIGVGVILAVNSPVCIINIITIHQLIVNIPEESWKIPQVRQRITSNYYYLIYYFFSNRILEI